ncbi:MAG TPA: ADP-glyceromanno-heptose 6-epimerase [Vicinamibacterales bacterium]|nr:ADP-glyceromanno-heptose 6-epimerase [Vicinamibacterales bacterium]
MSSAAARSVVVTGAAGFVGARCVQALGARQVPVISVDQLDKFDTRPEHAGIDFGTRVHMDAIDAWLAEHGSQVRAIVHMGACTDTRETDRAYLDRVNVSSSQQLWNRAIQLGVPFIYASSAATYGDGAMGYDDDERLIPRLKPLNAYGDSKQEFDLWALGEEAAGRKPPHWTGLKFFNVYGFGERHKGPMSSVVIQAFDQIRAKGRVKLFKSHRAGIADGHQARDFVFVDDVVGVLVGLAERPVTRGIFNLGSGKARTFLDLATAVFTALGQSPQIEFIDTPPDLQRTYQYFTEAPMARLRAAGYAQHATPLEAGVASYVNDLMAATRA